MSKQLLLYFFLCICISSYGQNWLWGGESNQTDDSYGVTIGNNGSAYMAGSFYSSITFGNQTLYTPSMDAFLVKYDENGNVLWARQSKCLVPSGLCKGIYVYSDSQGNVYYTGMFGDTICFGNDTLEKVQSSASCVFLVKYDENGNLLWARQSTSPSINKGGTGLAIATDASDNVFVTGYFYDTISFGTFVLRDSVLEDKPDMFLVKYAENGNVLWATQSENTGPYNTASAPYSIATDNLGNVYVHGTFSSHISFDTVTLLHGSWNDNRHLS